MPSCHSPQLAHLKRNIPPPPYVACRSLSEWPQWLKGRPASGLVRPSTSVRGSLSSTSDFDGHVCTANEGRPVELVLRRPVPREDAVVLTPVNDEALRVALRRHH